MLLQRLKGRDNGWVGCHVRQIGECTTGCAVQVVSNVDAQKVSVVCLGANLLVGDAEVAVAKRLLAVKAPGENGVAKAEEQASTQRVPERCPEAPAVQPALLPAQSAASTQ